MKKKKLEIRKETAHPKLDRAQYDALVAELSKPERLAHEAGRLIERLRDERELFEIRFEPEALGAAALAAGAGTAKEQAARAAEGLVTDALREALLARLDRLAKRGGALQELLPYRVGRFLLEAEMGGKVAPGKSALWIGVLQVSALEAPLELYARGRPPAELRAEAAAARARPGFERFLAEDARAVAIRGLLAGADLEAMLIHFSLGFARAAELVLPFEAALHGPVEAARAARRRQALVGIGRGESRAQESMRVIAGAVEKDRARATEAYRALLLDLWDEARGAAAPARPAAGPREEERIFAALLGLEALEPARNLPLLAAYEAAGPHAAEEAEPWAQPLLHAILARPLDTSGYRAYAQGLAASGNAERARTFARAALDALGEDAGLRAVAGPAS
jgi:hypothetical protein